MGMVLCCGGEKYFPSFVHPQASLSVARRGVRVEDATG